MASLSRQLAQWVVGLRYDDLPPAVVDRAKGVTLHSLASVLLGSQSPGGQQAVKLVTDERVVEVIEFETTDAALRGEMTIKITLADANGGTDIFAVHDGLPPGLSAADNESGWRSSLAKLAALVEAA